MKTAYYQPQGKVSINATNPITRGLVAAWVPGLGDVVQNKPFNPTVDGVVKAGPKGKSLALAVPGGNAPIGAIPMPKPASGSFSAITELFIMYCTTRRMYGAWVAGDGSIYRWGGEYNDAEISWKIHGPEWLSVTQVFIGTSPVSLVGAVRTIVGVWNKDKESGLGRVWVDGTELQGNGGTGQTGVSNTAASTAASTCGPGQQDNMLFLRLQFDRDLSPEEVRSLSANPWQVFSEGEDYEDLEPFKSNMMGPATTGGYGGRPAIRQPQSRTVVDPKLKADFAWIAYLGSLAGPASYLQPGTSKIVTPEGVGIGTGRAVVQGNFPSMITTTWTEIGVINIPTGNSVITVSGRNHGQGLVWGLGGVNAVIWGVDDVPITFPLLPAGIIRYVVRRVGSAHRVWVNGRLIGSATNSKVPLNIGNWASVGSQAGSGPEVNNGFLTGGSSVLAVVRTPLGLSDQQCVELSRNPWAAFSDTQQYEDEEAPAFISNMVGSSSSYSGSAGRVATRQPQGKVMINQGHPLAKGLVHLLWMGDTYPRDLVNPEIPFYYDSTITRTPGPKGMSYRSPGVDTKGLWGPRGAFGKAKLINAPLTLAVFCNINSGHAGGPAIIAGVGDGFNGGYCIYNAYGNMLGAVAGNISRQDQTGALQPADQLLAITVSGTEFAMYKGGRKVDSVQRTPSAIAYDMNYGRLQAFGNPYEATYGAGGRSYFQAAWSRELTAAEIQSLHINPWQLFLADQDYEDLDLIRQIEAQIRKALYRNGQGYVLQSSGGLGVKPLVLLDGRLKERSGSEGVPVYFDGTRMRTLGPGESINE